MGVIAILTLVLLLLLLGKFSYLISFLLFFALSHGGLLGFVPCLLDLDHSVPGLLPGLALKYCWLCFGAGYHEVTSSNFRGEHKMMQAQNSLH